MQLDAAGWGVLVIWECETKSQEAVRQALLNFLGPLFAPDGDV